MKSARRLDIHVLGYGVCLVSLSLLGCSGGPRARVQSAIDARDVDAAAEAYDRFRAVDGDDPALLGRIAGLVLRAGAESEDVTRRDAAMTELRSGGVAALPTLTALSSAEDATVRALAQSARLALGDTSAAPYLAALADDADPVRRAASLAALDPVEDRPKFLRALADTDARVRRAACLAVGHGPPDGDLRLALAMVARVDPDRTIRAAATRALGAYGSDAVEALRGRLGDPFSSVRLAAVGALLRADPVAGAAAVSALLATPPSPAGIEAARRLATLESVSDADRLAARAYLRGALTTHDATLRSQVAVALASLADPSLDAALRAALDSEQDDGVRLGLARALLRRGDAAALPALRALLEGQGMLALLAAALLSRRGDEDAIAHIEASLEDDSALVRRVAMRSLAVDASQPFRIFALLRDEDPLVRIYAAGAILAASNR